jgi:NAD(P)-dependent dehydrogenase (short-subunit alcohol dehydrogenase family)
MANAMGVLNDKTAIVIGGGRGIGRAVALLFAREGARVLVNDLGSSREGTGADADVAKAVAEEIETTGGKARANADDAATEDGAARIVNAAVAAFGKVDTLVYAAGVLGDQAMIRADAATFQRVLGVHLTGAFFATRAAAEVMQRAGGGRIVLTTSSAGLLGNFGQAAYSAAAAGVYGLMRAASIELQRRHVFVNAVAPMAKTRLTEDLPLFEEVNTMTAEHAAPAYLFFASELSGDATGNVLGVAGGRISTYRLTESSGRFKEADAGVWTADEIREQWGAMGTGRP